MSFGPYSIVAAPVTKPPFPVDALVEEEDTFLVLSAERPVRVPGGSLVEVMTKVIETRPEVPGSVLPKGDSPPRYLAIVHDLNQDPTWREEWIESALDRVFQISDERKIQTIALPLLGTLHGDFDKRRFVVLLRRVLERVSPVYLRRIWMVTPSRTPIKILEMFRAVLEK